MAGTILVRTNPRTSMNDIVFKPTDDNYQPEFLQASELKDDDISLIHEVMNTYFKTGNSDIVHTLADRIREHLQINLPSGMNSMQFLQTIVKDYSHLSSVTDPLTNN